MDPEQMPVANLGMVHDALGQLPAARQRQQNVGETRRGHFDDGATKSVMARGLAEKMAEAAV